VDAVFSTGAVLMLYNEELWQLGDRIEGVSEVGRIMARTELGGAKKTS
jgi:hypothetical protein